MTTSATAPGASKPREIENSSPEPQAEVTNPDDWPAVLRMGLKNLNVKTVGRAAEFFEVLPMCLSHNLRQRNDGHRHRGTIDKARTPRNTVLFGADRLDVAAELVRSVFDELGITPSRRDNVAGIELVMQPPPGWDRHEFWAVCLDLARKWFDHVVSAVIHRDQKRPHMHVLALALAGGRLSGDALTSGPNRYEARKAEFLRVMRERLGLRPDRPAKTFDEIMISPGRGAKTHAEAARRDAALGQPHARTPFPPDPIPKPHTQATPCPDPHLRSVFALHGEGVALGVFAAFSAGEPAPAPRPDQPLADRSAAPADAELLAQADGKDASIELAADLIAPDSASRSPSTDRWRPKAKRRSIRTGSGDMLVRRPAAPEFAATVHRLRLLDRAASEDERIVMSAKFCLNDRVAEAAECLGRKVQQRERERAFYAARMAKRALDNGLPVRWTELIDALSKPGAFWLDSEPMAVPLTHRSEDPAVLNSPTAPR